MTEAVDARLGDVVRLVRPSTTESVGLRGGGGGGTSGGVTDDALKPRVDFLQSAFLWLAGFMITAILAFVAVIFATSAATNARVDALGVKVDRLAEVVAGFGREVSALSVKMDERGRRLDRGEAGADRRGVRTGATKAALYDEADEAAAIGDDEAAAALSNAAFNTANGS